MMKLNLKRLMTPSDARTCVAGAGILAAVACGMAVQGCGGICSQIEANVPAVNAKLADVQRAIGELDRSGIRDRLTTDQQATYDTAMERLKQGYALAVQSTALASEACSDSRQYFDMIVQAWTLVRPFVFALIGGADGVPRIADPIIYTEAMR